MTSAFQSIFDLAESISINKKKNVAQTTSRDGVVRSLSLGGQVWEFEVKMPDGIPWTTLRPIIEQVEALDRTTAGTVAINKSGHSWINGYQGNFATTGTVQVEFTASNTLTIVTQPSLVSGYKFKSGDFIQLGTAGKVYTVVDDVLWSSNTITVHRPIRDNTGTHLLRIGQAVEWNVICTNLPQWNLFARNQVSWNGTFLFSEVI